MSDDDVRVPAGWYPDPLGLPQLRWWDNRAWTEHTSDARQPMVAQATATRLEYADPFADLEGVDEELPAATDDASDLLFGTPELSHADPVLSLEAPAREELIVDEASPAQRYAAQGVPAGAPTSAAYNLDTRFDDLLGDSATPRTASSHLGDQETRYVPEASAEPRYADDYPTRRASHRVDSRADGRSRYDGVAPSQTGTGPVWVIALMPLALLVIGLLFLLSGLSGPGSPIFLAIVLGVPYLLVVVLAIADHRALLRLGFEQPAHWAWAFLTAPAYLVVRMTAVVRETGRGFGPLMTWGSLGVVLVASVFAVPGLVIALAPAAFAQEAEQSVVADAAALGATLQVACPDIPPMLPGQSFACHVRNASGGQFDVIVSLQRANGWIDWRVDDWGIRDFGQTG